MAFTKTSAVAACLLLAACAREQAETVQGLDKVGTETSASYNKVRDYLGLGHQPKPASKGVSVPPRYCYKTYQDVICYAQPLPGEEYRLTGYQSASGKTGYTLPPTHIRDESSQAAVSPPLKPVTVPPPPAVKPDKNADKPKDGKQLKEVIFDPAELQPKDLVPEKPQ